MKVATQDEVAADFAAYVKATKQGPVVVTSKGKPVAVLAIAAVHEIDYLLTWNYAHMANPVVQAQFDKLCEAAELVAPLMVSPESIPQVRFGQSIRRK